MLSCREDGTSSSCECYTWGPKPDTGGPDPVCACAHACGHKDMNVCARAACAVLRWAGLCLAWGRARGLGEKTQGVILEPLKACWGPTELTQGLSLRYLQSWEKGVRIPQGSVSQTRVPSLQSPKRAYRPVWTEMIAAEMTVPKCKHHTVSCLEA